MPVLTIEPNMWGRFVYHALTLSYGKEANPPISYMIRVGTNITMSDQAPATQDYYRGWARYSLATLSVDAVISQVRLLYYVSSCSGASHLLDIHAYDTNGQFDPCTDDGASGYPKCASGNLYIDDSDSMRTPAWKTYVLPAQACTDVENAKDAVDRYTVAFHEEGDNDPFGEFSLSPQTLEITYTLPSVGYGYTDGLVSVSVISMLMHKAILTVCGKSLGRLMK